MGPYHKKRFIWGRGPKEEEACVTGRTLVVGLRVLATLMQRKT